MPDLLEVRADVVVDASVEDTWAAVTDWENQGSWIPATTVRVTSGDGRSVGSTLDAFTGAGPVGFVDPMLITVWDPPRRCVVEHQGRVVRGTGVFEVIELPHGRSRFVWAEQMEMPRPLRLGLSPVRPVGAALLKLALRRLARHVAGG